MRTNFILLDYENVQTIDLKAFDIDGVRVIVFLGENQTKLSSELVLKMQALKERGQFVQLCGNGPNSLDFTIAFTIGQLSRDEPSAYFHIISKDTGFDPLLKYMKGQKLFAARHSCPSEAPFAKAASLKSPAERADAFVSKMSEPKATRPRTLKTLANSIKTCLQGQISAEESAAIIALLKSRKVIAVDGDKVTYPGLVAK